MRGFSRGMGKGSQNFNSSPMSSYVNPKPLLYDSVLHPSFCPSLGEQDTVTINIHFPWWKERNGKWRYVQGQKPLQIRQDEGIVQ
jgi:hypothetical protein